MAIKKSVEDLKVAGKRVLVRCDFNVPLKDGVITDENRIVAALPTIKYLLNNNAKVILCSHLGKPKGVADPKYSLAPVAVRLSEKLGINVNFAADDEVVGENARKAVAAMKDGEVVLLQNTRYRAEETKNGEAFSKELASLADLFVNDAFGAAHRAHCSTVGVASFVEESANGYLMAKEIKFLGDAVNSPVRPFVTILGGAKVADKLAVIENLLNKADTLIIGGGRHIPSLKLRAMRSAPPFSTPKRLITVRICSSAQRKRALSSFFPLTALLRRASPTPLMPKSQFPPLPQTLSPQT